MPPRYIEQGRRGFSRGSKKFHVVTGNYTAAVVSCICSIDTFGGFRGLFYYA